MVCDLNSSVATWAGGWEGGASLLFPFSLVGVGFSFASPENCEEAFLTLSLFSQLFLLSRAPGLVFLLSLHPFRGRIVWRVDRLPSLAVTHVHVHIHMHEHFPPAPAPLTAGRPVPFWTHLEAKSPSTFSRSVSHPQTVHGRPL